MKSTSHCFELAVLPCARFRMGFARLRYPETLAVAENTIRQFFEIKVTENAFSKQPVSDERNAPIGIVLPFKKQKSANAVRHRLGDLSRKIDTVVQLVHTSQKIKGQFKSKTSVQL